MRLLDLFSWRRRREDDLQDEIASHLALATEERTAAGEDPREARFGALREFGNVTLAREATRMTWGFRWIEQMVELLRDVRYALRLVVRTPAYALIVITVVAFGIGCNVIAFSLYKALALAPLAGVADSGSMHFIGGRSRAGQPMVLSVPEYRYLHDHSFPRLGATAIQPLILGQGTSGQRVIAEFVSGNYFAALGVDALYGRMLRPSDDVLTGNHQVVVLSVGLWRRAFGGDPQIIGRTIHLNAQPMTIIGVSDPRFRGSVVGLATDLFAPLITHAQLTGENRETTSNDHSIMAFLRVPAVELARVRASMSRASAELAAAYPQPFDDRLERAVLIPIWQWPYGAQSLMLPAVSLIGAMAALLLLVVCANVTGLVLARSVGRRGEIAARLAVGASRARILRQLLIESLVLALPAAMAGLFLPRLAEPFLGRAAADVSSFPLFFNLEPDRLVLAFALALAWISALLYGLAPALRLARVDVATILKEDASPLRPSGGHFRNALVIIQIAMSLMLLVGTSLVVRTLPAAQHADGGFDAHHVAWATFDMRASGHDQTGGRRMYERLLDAIRAEPGVESASLAAYLPLTLIDWQNWNFVPEGYRPRPDEDVSFAVNVVSPGHFQTLRIALLAGRDFSDRDTVETEPVVIINETFARRFWRTPQEAIGQRVEGNGLRRVIGVVRDMKYARLDEQPRPYAYVASGQVYAPEMTLQVRATGTTADVLQRIRSRARAIDASLPVLASGALADQTRSAVALYGTVARIVAMIGMLSAGLAGLGVYGLIAYSVKQSAREIGIRSAMGATPVDIGGRFLRQGITVGCVGVLAGLAIAFALSRLMAAMLFGVAATDPISFISAAAAVLGVALGASSIPAWRAAGVDPLTALRDH